MKKKERNNKVSWNMCDFIFLCLFKENKYKKKLATQTMVFLLKMFSFSTIFFNNKRIATNPQIYMNL